MTRINLLSREVIKRRKEKRFVALSIVVGVIVVFGLGFLYTSKKAELNGLKKSIAMIDQEISKYKEVETQLNIVKEEKAEIIKRLNAIKQLIETDRQLWSHLLDEMSKSLPEGVWLKSMNDKGEDHLEISACALDNFAVAHYMVNLMKNAYFDEVELQGLNKTSIGEYDLREFNLTLRYNRKI